MTENKEKRYFACDFETTTDENAKVWSACIAEMFKDNEPVIYSNIDAFMWCLVKNYKRGDFTFYFHNLKFDGNFIVVWLLNNGFTYKDESRLKHKEFSMMTSDMGSWYSVSFKMGRTTYKFVDSLKLVPMSLKAAGKAFNTKHQKLEMQYDNKSSLKDCTKEDIEYIKNDVYVLKEVMEYLINMGLTKMTIGGNCLEEYKALNPSFADEAPCLLDMDLPEDEYGAPNIDAYIRKAYRGGWCYVHRKGVFEDGCTYDVNSLYPSVMTEESGNPYPIGKPYFWKGNYIPDEAYENKRVFIIRFKCSFNLKEGYLPTIQIKGSIYKYTEYLTTSDWVKDGKRYHYTDYGNGKEVIRPTLTLTSVDFELFKEHYDITDLEILDGCYFETKIGLFDVYIQKWAKMKIDATKSGNKGLRTLAKLFLNNLYGKLATSPDGSHKVPYLDKDGILHWHIVKGKDKKVVHIAMGAFVTAYARKFTITAAQANVDRFCYADTDSIHLIGTDDAKGVKEDATAFLCWKRESDWDKATFIRQKTYAEHIVKEDREECNGYWNVKGCGCPERSKNLFLETVDGKERVKDKDKNEEEWVRTHNYTIEDFKIGISIPGKLRPKQVKNGVVLTKTTFTMK